MAVALLWAGALVALSATGAPPSKHEATLFQQKLDAIKIQKHRRTVLTENELNAYFQFNSAKDLPVGVIDPAIAIQAGGRLWGRAVVDLDAVRKANPPKSLLDPKNLLIGRLPIAATGVLTTSNGIGRFSLESASVGGLPLPKFLLQEILSYYSRSPEKPDGINLD